MVTTKQILRNTVRPREALMTVNSKFTYVSQAHDYNRSGVDVMDEDWDTLIILDACRYDIFAEHHDLPGKLESRISRGGGTVEFLRGNFRDRELPDTVYVTATPQISRLQSELNVEFHDIVDVWTDRWDNDIQNVPPDEMTDAARDALEKYPNKRLIIHYNQPHGPFLGPTAEELVIGPNREADPSLLEFLTYELKHDLVTAEDWRAALRETFEIVHDYVAELLEEIDGKTVVTADHGEMLGERGSPIPISYCGHQIGIHHDALVKVPWLVYESGDRREIESGEKTESGSQDYADQSVGERLRDLGYMN